MIKQYKTLCSDTSPEQ